MYTRPAMRGKPINPPTTPPMMAGVLFVGVGVGVGEGVGVAVVPAAEVSEENEPPVFCRPVVIVPAFVAVVKAALTEL